MSPEDENALINLVRIGVVSAVNAADKTARVIFEDKNITSGWLHILQHGGAGVSIKAAGIHTHSITDTFTGGGSASDAGGHIHAANVTTWIPAINDSVVVLYLPVFNGDGFILGAL